VSERQYANNPAPELRGVWDSGGDEAPRRAGLASMEPDDGGQPEVAAGPAGFDQARMDDLYFGQRIVPAPYVEEQQAESAMRLARPDYRTDLICEIPSLLSGGQRLRAPVELG
jgi:hypothetical protein